jgi:hypothetical protein
MPLGPYPLPNFDTPACPAGAPSRLWVRMRTEGPLYRKGDLRHALRTARIALDERPPGDRELRSAA